MNQNPNQANQANQAPANPAQANQNQANPANQEPEDQANIVGVKTIDSLNDQDRPDSVVLLDKDGKPTIKKSYAEIIGPAEEPGENAAKAKEVLGKIKQDEGKMGQVVKFAEFIQDDKNKDKVAEIQKILNQ